MLHSANTTKQKFKSKGKSNTPTMSVYDMLAKDIIDSLNKGIVPWNGQYLTSPPMNCSGVRYKGYNHLILRFVAARQGYSNPYWTTLKNANEHGFNIRKGERSTPISYYKPFTVTNNDGDEETKFTLKYFNVFNLQQLAKDDTKDHTWQAKQAKMQALIDYKPVHKKELGFDPHETIIPNAVANICAVNFDKTDASYYTPTSDSIHMPPMELFNTDINFFTTLMHELAHASGAEHRLNRLSLKNYFTNKASRAEEELLVEFAAMFIASEYDLVYLSRQDHLAYIQSWANVLKNDTRKLFSIAKEASKIAEYVLTRIAEGGCNE